MTGVDSLFSANKPGAPNARLALFLDFDGTLVDIAARPELVHVPGWMPCLMRAWSKQLDGALAIVTGRKLADVDAFLQPLLLTGAGLHGAEMRLAPDAGIDSVIGIDLGAAAARVQVELGALAGIEIENKRAALAVHYRARPDAGPEVERALRRAVLDAPVEIVAGKCVFEARPHGINKGTAVRTLMQRAPFAGRTPVFIGDDVTDEDGIAAVQELGGFGIKVGDAQSVARYRLRDPSAVAEWLSHGIDACADLSAQASPTASPISS